MNTTRHVAARDSNWSQATINDGWGDNITDDQIAQCVDLVIREFHHIAEKNNSSAHWTPYTSEVTAYITEDIDSETLTEWRETALERVWTAVLGDLSPLTDEVAAILEPDKLAEITKIVNTITRMEESRGVLPVNAYTEAFGDIAAIIERAG